MKGRISFVMVGIVVAVVLMLRPADAEPIDHHGLAVQDDSRVDCLGCHDGSLGKAVEVCSVGCGFKTSHTVLTEYPPRGRARDYAPVAALAAKGIRLVNGKITCISCHDLRKPGKHLVMDNTGSRLCLACHVRF